MKAILGAGALVAVDRRDRMIGAQLRVLLAGVGIEALGMDDGKRIGELLALAASADVVNAHVALMAAHADLVLTSDPADIRKLLQARKISARVQAV